MSENFINPQIFQQHLYFDWVRITFKSVWFIVFSFSIHSTLYASCQFKFLERPLKMCYHLFEMFELAICTNNPLKRKHIFSLFLNASSILLFCVTMSGNNDFYPQDTLLQILYIRQVLPQSISDSYPRIEKAFR